MTKYRSKEIVEAIEFFGKHRSGLAGAKARARKLTSDERRDIAKKAAAARWG